MPGFLLSREGLYEPIDTAMRLGEQMSAGNEEMESNVKREDRQERVRQRLWSRIPIAPRLAAMAVAICVAIGFTWPAVAQEVADAVPTLAGGSTKIGGESSILRMLFGGSALGTTIVVSILLLSVVSLYSIVDHALTVTRRRIMPAAVLDELERLIAHGEIHRAIEYCGDRKNASLATEVIKAGLYRFQHSEFGFAEYRSAVEEAGEDQTSRLYRRTEVLNVISAIAPMMGLTGTVLGMIEAFNTIAAKDGMATPPELASGIGQALITTLLGLFVAIPSMIALSFFRNKIDSLVAETGKRVERIMMPLGRKKAKV